MAKLQNAKTKNGLALFDKIYWKKSAPEKRESKRSSRHKKSDNFKLSMENSGSRAARYNGSCPSCHHGTMMPLAQFLECDVNDTPTVESFQAPNRGFGMTFPDATVFLMLTTWLGNLLFGQARIARNRAKVKRARQEILPRSPNSAICPNCYETLERF